MAKDLSARLQKAGRARVVVSHAVGAAHDGRYAVVKVVLFGGAIEFYTLPAALAYWLIDRISEAMAALAIQDRRSDAEAGSPEAQQLALHVAARPEIGGADWDRAARSIVSDIHAQAFGNALGLLLILEDGEAQLILPDQAAMLLHEQLSLAATYLMDQAHAPPSYSGH